MLEVLLQRQCGMQRSQNHEENISIQTGLQRQEKKVENFFCFLLPWKWEEAF